MRAKEHPLYPGYFFSSDGKAYHMLDGGVFRELSGCQCGIGYRAISVPTGTKKYKRVYIHRAVCELFNGEPQGDGQQCRHLDGDLTNNSSGNLAWGTAKDNAIDMARHGKTAKGERNPMAVLNVSIVADMRKVRADTGLYYKDIAERFGVSTMTAFRAITGRSWA